MGEFVNGRTMQSSPATHGPSIGKRRGTTGHDVRDGDKGILAWVNLASGKALLSVLRGNVVAQILAHRPFAAVCDGAAPRLIHVHGLGRRALKKIAEYLDRNGETKAYAARFAEIDGTADSAADRAEDGIGRVLAAAHAVACESGRGVREALAAVAGKAIGLAVADAYGYKSSEKKP